MAHVLIVDDDDFVCRSIGMLVEAEGHSIDRVQTGVAAKALLESRNFDLLLTDIRMSPMDGLQLIKAAHEAKPDMPIVVVSALTSDRIVDEARKLGAVEYVKKPFRIDDILNAIDRALKKV